VTRTKQSLVKVWNNLKSDHVKGKMSNDERDVSASWCLFGLEGKGEIQGKRKQSTNYTELFVMEMPKKTYHLSLACTTSHFFLSSPRSSDAAGNTMAAPWATQQRPAGEEVEVGLTERLSTSSALGNM
jgi:hypothetical protein